MQASTTKPRWAYLPECEAPPTDWTVVPFTKIATVIAGQSPPSESYNQRSEGLPFLQGNADFSYRTPLPRVWCNSPHKTSRKGDTLFSVRAPVGEVNRSDRNYAIGRGLAAIRAKGCDADFLYYALQRWRLSLQLASQGTTFDAITARHFADLFVALPTKKTEQAAIARILNAVDKTIERAREAVERAQVLEQSVLEEAYCNLEAESRRLGEFCADVRYGTSKPSNFKGWGNPVLRIPNVMEDRLALDDIAYVDLPSMDVERLRLVDGDVLLVRTNGNPNYVGRSVVFRQPDAQIWVYASYLIRIRMMNTLLPDYVNVFLGLERGRRELLRRVTTSAGNHNINSNSIRLIQLPVPVSHDVQKEIVELAKGCRLLVDGLKWKTKALDNLKRSLLHDLLTAKVRVGDIAGVSAS